jgi:hypothetical protein
MVQFGRVACITAPFLLSIAALVTLILIFLAGTMERNSTTGDLYFVNVRIPPPPLPTRHTPTNTNTFSHRSTSKTSPSPASATPPP